MNINRCIQALLQETTENDGDVGVDRFHISARAHQLHQDNQTHSNETIFCQSPSTETPTCKIRNHLNTIRS
jgi:hypothetical protein